MNTTPSKYRKKPVVVEAMPYWPTLNCRSVYDFMGLDYNEHHHSECTRDAVMLIETLEGTMTASPADWIIKGVNGEFYPCKPGIFMATYERADQ